MAKAIGKAASSIWWLAGLVMALAFGRTASGRSLPMPKYGVRPPPDVESVLAVLRGRDVEKNRPKAEKLVAEYLDPTGTVTELYWKAEVIAAAQKLVAKLSGPNQDHCLEASKKLVAMGPAALPALRRAAAGKDAKLAAAAKKLIAVIEAKLQEEINDLFVQFGASAYRQREAATRQMVEIGPAAFRALRRAVAHNNPEVAHRARLAIEGIEDRIRSSALAALRQIPLATRLVLASKMSRLSQDVTRAATAFQQAVQANQTGKILQTRAALELTQGRMSRAQTLYYQAALGGMTIIETLPQPAYGVVRPLAQLRYGVMRKRCF